jgi:hypothetical protein
MDQTAFQTVVILIKGADRMDDGLRTGRILLQAGMRVRIFLFGNMLCAADEDSLIKIQAIRRMGAETLADLSVADPQYGDISAPIARMADGLLEADTVITF